MRTSDGRYGAGRSVAVVSDVRRHESHRSESDPLVVQAAPDLQIIYADVDVDVDESPVQVRAPQPGSPTPGLDNRVKRLFDLVVALAALIVTLPVWIVVFLFSVVGRQGPVLYAQDRVGRNGRSFRCLKFRTMHPDADQVLQRILDSDPDLARQWAETRKLSGDPRITSLGRFLRRFDLDEIPQFVNILRGEMSMVGPRPVVPGETDRFGYLLPIVLSVRPGLTGLWQVSGRNEMAYGDRVRREAAYARTRSFVGDLVICIRTPSALLRGNNER